MRPQEREALLSRQLPDRGLEPRWPGDLDKLNQAIPERTQSEGRVFLTDTKLRGASWLLACILHYATAERDLDALPEGVKAQSTALAARRA